MRQATQTRKVCAEKILPQKMKYIDLHCDSATVCLDRGYALTNNDLHVNLDKLKEADCAAQCFAIFTDGEGARESFEKYLNFFLSSVRLNKLTLVDCFQRLISRAQSKKPCAILTVENLGFTGGNEEEIIALRDKGVLMASLVWNSENCYAYPNLIFKGGMPDFSECEKRGLKEKGREAVELLDSLKIIVDVSHLSDGGTDEILDGRKIPIVASHSNARAIRPMPRNLTDKQIRGIADCGGVVGINFCKDFLGDGKVFELVKRHLEHMIKIGGENVVAFGSDFDGIPTVKGLEGCEKMPALIEYLDGVFGNRITEKLCFKNFARVLKDVRP